MAKAKVYNKLLEKLGQSKNNVKSKKKTPQGFFPVYVGEECKKYMIPVSCLSSIMFKALLNQFDEENELSLRPICLSCSTWMFEAILNLAKSEKEGSDEDFVFQQMKIISGRLIIFPMYDDVQEKKKLLRKKMHVQNCLVHACPNLPCT